MPTDAYPKCVRCHEREEKAKNDHDKRFNPATMTGQYRHIGHGEKSKIAIFACTFCDGPLPVFKTLPER